MKNLVRLIFILFVLVSCRSTRNVGNNYMIVNHNDKFVADYASKYAGEAMVEMQRTGIPASITLAQGMIESDFGRSRLATEANNHFGIKCHNNWNGKKIFHDDDKRRECFRKYNRVEDSYQDHSDFLISGVRYAFLFDLKPDDYREWAKGLKRAGYATNPKYAGLLIDMIEENDLYIYDRQVLGQGSRLPKVRYAKPKVNIETVTAVSGSRVKERNRIQYIVVNKDDTYESIIDSFDLLSWELFRYNDLDDDSELVPGQLIYLQPKRNKAEVGNDFHIIKEGETMQSVSQLYGVKLKVLYERNNISPGLQPKVGTELWLRRTKPVDM